MTTGDQECRIGSAFKNQPSNSPYQQVKKKNIIISIDTEKEFDPKNSTTKYSS